MEKLKLLHDPDLNRVSGRRGTTQKLQVFKTFFCVRNDAAVLGLGAVVQNQKPALCCHRFSSSQQ